MELFQALTDIMFAAYVMVIEARDENGNPGTGHLARARLVITVLDVNDVPPLFKRRKYEGFMSSDLTRLRNNLQVEAVDLDKTGTRNSDVRCGQEQNYLLKIDIEAWMFDTMLTLPAAGTRSSLGTTSRSSA